MSKSDTKVFSKKVHVFKAGPQTSAQGVQRDFSSKELEEVVNSYNPEVHTAPLVIGHSGDNDSVPAYGWIKGFSKKGDDLYADVDFTDAAKDLVKKGHYRKVSISFYSPDSPINPHKGKWSARHLALLGAAPPAVKGLEPFSFSEEEGIYNFATTLSPDDIFDKDLGPTLLVEKSPLEVLKERLDDVKNEVDESLQQLQQNQDQQTETDVGQDQQPETTNSVDQNATPENPNQQFSEMKKKLGREGAEIAESTQQIANLETKAPENKTKMSKQTTEEETMEEEAPTEAPDMKGKKAKEAEDEEYAELPKAKAKPAMTKEGEEVEDEEEAMEDEESEYEEGIKRRTSKGAGGQEVQVVEQVFEEGIDSKHQECTSSMKKKALEMAESDSEEVEEVEDGDSEYNELEYDEVSHKTASNGKVSFGTHKGQVGDKTTGRSVTGRSKDDSYADRQKVGKGPEEDREGVSKNGEQDKDRVKTAKSSEQDKDRVKTAKSSEGDDTQEGRWAGQDTMEKDRNDDQYDDSTSDYPEKQKPGTSSDGDPHGRSDGPTKVSKLSEQNPDNLEMAVDVKSVKGSKTSRVIHQSSSDKRAPLKGGPISDHAEGGEPDAEGIVREPKTAKTATGKSPKGRVDGPTDFPTRSEQEPDDLEMAVDVKDATESDKVRIIRQKSGDKPSVNHAEPEMSRRKKVAEIGDPMTVTGKGSTYKENEYGMGSTGQARPAGYPEQVFKELEALKKENDRLKKEFEEQKVRSHKQKISHFVENLYAEGKLTDAIIEQDDLQSFCEGLEFGTLEFAEGETPTTKLFSILNRLPSMVHFGEIVGPEDKSFEPAPEDLDPHERALQMVKRGEASDYVEAIKLCLFTNN